MDHSESPKSQITEITIECQLLDCVVEGLEPGVYRGRAFTFLSIEDCESWISEHAGRIVQECGKLVRIASPATKRSTLFARIIFANGESYKFPYFMDEFGLGVFEVRRIGCKDRPSETTCFRENLSRSIAQDSAIADEDIRNLPESSQRDSIAGFLTERRAHAQAILATCDVPGLDAIHSQLHGEPETGPANQVPDSSGPDI